jgi:hypothetical protein
MSKHTAQELIRALSSFHFDGTFVRNLIFLNFSAAAALAHTAEDVQKKLAKTFTIKLLNL